MNNPAKDSAVEVSVVLPCRNEEASIGGCIKQIKDVFKQNYIRGELIVSDSSIDRSPDIAKKLGAILVKHDKEGYGNAYLEGFKHVNGRYIFCADADGTYDFREIPKFIKELQDDNTLVVGNRFGGKIHEGSMPFMHRYIGNPVLSLTLRVLFGGKVHDTHCGMRAFTKEVLKKLNLQTTGMEFASEMVIQAVKNNVQIKELPIDYYQRRGESKLRTLSDGWRHLRFMLLYSPTFLFLYPGLFLFLLGITSMLWLYYMDIKVILSAQILPYLIASSLLILMGVQIMIFALFTKTYAMTNLCEKNIKLERFYKFATLEKGIIFASILAISGMAFLAFSLYSWQQSGFSELDQVKNTVVALTLLILGIQTFFSSFMISILGIGQKR